MTGSPPAQITLPPEFKVIERRDWRFWLALAAVLAPFGLVVVYTWCAGTLSTDDCTFTTALRLASGNTDTDQVSSCRAAPLLFDLPSLLLGLGIMTSLSVHVYYLKYLRKLGKYLDEIELYDYWSAAHPRPPGALDDLAVRLQPRRSRRIMLAVALALLGVLFYWLADARFGYLFQTIIDTQNLTQPNGEPLARREIQLNWWADWHHHKFGAACWYLVGVVGAYFAILDLLRSLALAGAVGDARARDDLSETTMSRHVDHGLRPLTILEDLKFVGMLVFAMVSVALVYLCRSPGAEWTNFALGALLVTVLSYSMYSVHSLRKVRRTLREDVFAKRLTRAHEQLDVARAQGDPHVTASAELKFAAIVESARWLYGQEDSTSFAKGTNVVVILLTFYGSLLAVFPAVRPF